jgi:hypothetical protein
MFQAGNTGVHDTVVNQLLAKIDGVDQLNNILVIGREKNHYILFCLVEYKSHTKKYYLTLYIRAHQTRRSGRLFPFGFNEIAQFLSKSEVLVSLFKSVFFSPIIILFLQYSHNRSSHVPEI